jgi:hypothetical protein
VINFVNFSFALFTPPPLGDYHKPLSPAGGLDTKLKKDLEGGKFQAEYATGAPIFDTYDTAEFLLMLVAGLP